ncbi:hypothetical protein AD929_02190 [Gluconobacter potus]|uniref:Uncharacterized protein n=1 Tax=Gluconobacter potus TaxID=2724927 RepID=A0A149QZ96_9PROT|nr:hypothetical protein AD929_02190 [Gluconobacter potus]
MRMTEKKDAAAGRDSPPFLKSCPQIFDQMPVSVCPFWAGDFWSVFPWWDDGTRSAVPKIFTEFM